ncbi:T9SS type A sorting domain-containing protein [Winogradskyella pulchriflava]|uniref:T9SS type A sorting domain-containing protein n=1 Tax=Winogradskyella pulchriflava TaxID=1110688 RepID=A0ABV6Q8B1_9FLAO
MKKITYFVLCLFIGGLMTANAQYSFPAEPGPVVVAQGSPVTLNINDAVNTAGVPAGMYSTFSVSVDWVANSGNPFASEADLTMITAAGSVLIDPATTGGNSSAAPTTMTFDGTFTADYDPATDGTMDIVLNQSWSGSVADWSNIVVTLYPALACTTANVEPGDVFDDCANDQFFVDFAYIDIGDSIGISDGTTTYPIVDMDVNTGPYSLGTSVTFTVVHSDPACDFSIGTFSDTCVSANDDCANAMPVACLDNLTFNTGGDTDTDGNGRVDTWFSFLGTVAGDEVTLATCGSDFDTTLTVYDACAGTEVAFNDDSCGLQSEVSFTSDAATTYLIRVEGYNTATGNAVLDVSCASTTPPSNDTCDTAIALDCDDNTDSGNSDLATDDDLNGYPEVWYSFTGDVVGDEVTISLCGSSFDTFMTVYTACIDGAIVTGNDDSCGLQSEVTFTSDGVSTYLIAVEGFNGATGNYEINVSCASSSIPDNDDCLSAEAILCNETVLGNSDSATDSDGNGSADVWYSYVGSVVDDTVTASLCGSGFDTIITVFDACDGTEVTANDDFCGLQSEVSWLSDGVTTYLIRVEGFDGETGDYELSFLCDSETPPANDEAAGAIDLPVGDTVCESPVLANNLYATTSVENVNTADCTFAGGIPQGDVWYKVTVPFTGEITVETSTTGEITDTVMTIYRGTSGNLVEVGCSDDEGTGAFSIIELTAADGISPEDVLLVRVWEYGDNEKGTFNVCAWSPTTLGIDDNTFEGFSYYPNPVKNTLTLNAQNTIEDVTMYNMLGQVVLKATPNAINTDVDMSALSNGAYFVQVTIANTTKTVRVIKQ